VREAQRIRLGVAPGAVWRGLVEPDLVRSWYFGLQPAGELTVGATREWRSGEVPLEQAVVRAIEPGRLLAYETRLLFSPALAQAPPVLVAWSIERAAGGCEVELAVESNEGGAAYRALAEKARPLLEGLRLAVDPAARAELARLPEIEPVEVRDVTPERLEDYQRFFDRDAFRDYPQWSDCYCMETHFGGGEAERDERTGDQNRADMSRLVLERQVTALLAYSGAKPVGWCNYGVTTRLAGVMTKLGLDAGEQAGVGSIACFVIAAPYRGHGVASALLEGALQRLRAAGCRFAEAYPSRSESPQQNYRGPLRMYLEAGFEPYRERERMVVVRKALT
jgi:GNAT superfamily N-acetyltransferase/uncharacterized protein YndB with AHSA1/START domain